MIGQHRCPTALGKHIVLQSALEIFLDEIFTALEESFADLTDEQVRAFPIAGRNNIAWIVMHTLQNLDEYAVAIQSARPVMQPERRWDLWNCTPEERPKPTDPFPTVAQLLDLTLQVKEAAFTAIHNTDEYRLLSGDPAWRRQPWRSDFYIRTLCHTHAHLRQIWLLRGALGITDNNPRHWPQQHWA